MTVFKTSYKIFATWIALCCVVLGFVAFPGAAYAQLGREVINVATISYDVNGEPLTFDTPPAIFIVEANRTPSTIEFFRYAPGAPDSFEAMLNGSDYSPTPSSSTAPSPDDPFVPIGKPITMGNFEIDTSRPAGLVPASTYVAGELMILRVIDKGQNGDPNMIETIIITVKTDSGDEIELRMYESDVDSGEFYAWVPSTRTATQPNDAALSVSQETQLTATYIDQFDQTEVSVDTALVDPFGRVFDSLTGRLVNGAVVTIIDVSTGLPARVYGVDGFSDYPSTVQTGSLVTDSSGLQYQLEEGEFQFPLMAPGQYRVEVGPPQGYIFKSAFAADAFAGLENAPFLISGASYGEQFNVDGTGPVNFDIPIDPAGELVLLKEASTATVAAGDTVAYTIEVINRDVVPAPVYVEDTLPRGLRFIDGSATANGDPLTIRSVSADGRTVRFESRILFPGESVRISYAANVAANVRLGEAVNQAVAVNTAGNPISNRAEAAVQVVEDLLRSKLTLIGRVAEQACDAEEEWSRSLEDGKGVEGVRLYMETGEYVVTDKDGLYHFQSVSPGTHVVQVDEATLPQGYELMVCEENSRYAGSPNSKFVDVRGGMVWRANFYLKQIGETKTVADKSAFNDATEYLQYDAEWLEAQAPEAKWVYPQADRTPSSRSLNIGIVHPKRHSVELSLNGQLVPGTNFSGHASAKEGEAEISRWRGVDILEGKNVFVARVLDAEGKEIRVIEKTISFVSDVKRATLVTDQSILVADGRTPPVVALRLENAFGLPVHKGRSVTVDVSEPYMLKKQVEMERSAPIIAAGTNAGVQAGENGVALVELEPTLQTGRVRLEVRLDDGRVEEIDVWLTPEKRDWIVVGLAEGGLELDKTTGLWGDKGTDTQRTGRLAFFAKGMIKGDWLMTLAVDTAKRRGNEDDTLFDDYIDPNAYYTLYGDETTQYAEAQSRYPLYVRLEKDAVSLMFGDYETALFDTELGRYTRRMSGLKGDIRTENFSATGFVAETNQTFQKNEIAADGTSGPYRVENAPMVRNSERIVIEARDRLRPDVIVSSRTMTRYFDYEIDFFTGEIIFRHPVNATDASFNPQVIVVDYEVSGNVERNVTAGGRAAIHTTNRALEGGLTVIREEGSAKVEKQTSLLVAADVKARLDENTELRAEVATSERDTGAGTERADAYLLEIERQSETLTVTGYYREEEAGFGLGQQSSNTDSMRRIGADVSALLADDLSKEGERRQRRYVDARAYREENLTKEAARDVVETNLRQETDQFGASVGLKAVREKYDIESDERTSLLLTGSARKTFVEAGLTLSATHEEPIGDAGDEATLFPRRTLLSADKKLTQWATLNLRHEMTNAEHASGNNTLAGVTVEPWVGGEVRIVGDMVTQDSAKQVGATIGVDQTFVIDDKWSASVGMARRARVDGSDDPRDPGADDVAGPLEDGVRSPLVNNENYTAAYAGVGYRAEQEAGSARLEYRNSDTGKRTVLTAGAAREAGENLSYGAALRAQKETRVDAPSQELVEARIGSAYRPRGEGTVVYNRFDVKHETVEGQIDQQKFVNNLGVNTMLTERTQAAIVWGVKYRAGEVAGQDVEGFTHLMGGELRHDVTEKIDIGIGGSVLIDQKTNTADYAIGPSIGFTPAKNVWVSAGYNFEGFTDEDFEGAEYSRKGVFVKVRVKFDQQTAKGLLDKISP